MKKLFTLMAMFATLACSIACDPANTNEEDDDDEGEVKEAIVIDGQFADWAALADCAVAANTPGSPWDAVEQIRVYATTDFVFYYIRFKESKLAELLQSADEELPIRLCINTDSEFTSGYANYFLEAYDYIIEGALAEGGAFTDFDGTLHQRFSSWQELLKPGHNLVSGKGAGCEYEICLIRDIFNSALSASADPKPMGSSFETGIRFYYTGGGEWAELSNMPNSSAEEGDGNGWGHLLSITAK